MEYIQEQLFEKRKYPRIGLEIQIIIKPTDDDSMIFGWIQDISHGGFKVRIDIPSGFKNVFHEGDIVIFKTDEDFFELKGRGDISWISIEGNEAGIKFDEIYDKNRKFFEEFLRMCS